MAATIGGTASAKQVRIEWKSLVLHRLEQVFRNGGQVVRLCMQRPVGTVALGVGFEPVFRVESLRLLEMSVV